MKNRIEIQYTTNVRQRHYEVVKCKKTNIQGKHVVSIDINGKYDNNGLSTLLNMDLTVYKKID